jgi:hypothetical protein
MDPVIDSSPGFLQDPSTEWSTLWLQQQQALQAQGDLFQQQQPQDPTQLWVLQQQAALDASSEQLQLQALLLQGNNSLDPSSAQLLLQALQQGNSGGSSLIDLSGLSISLQGSSLVPMQQQGINATINGVPVVLQLQDTAPEMGLQQLLPSNIPLPPMQQVYGTSAEQQVYIAPAAEQHSLLINTNQVDMQQAATQATMQPAQQQQPLLAGSAPNTGSSTDTVLHLQLQQLQEAVQQLSSQTAEVQRVLAAQVSQPQASQAQTVMLSMEVRSITDQLHGWLSRHGSLDTGARQRWGELLMYGVHMMVPWHPCFAAAVVIFLTFVQLAYAAPLHQLLLAGTVCQLCHTHMPSPADLHVLMELISKKLQEC